ncbi:MAG: hypothetical protein L0K41_00125 [Yaniella sp.]|uniref:hypothetical protein n=1 Tax=Yaniella sp. TaxID=2773929 RepID=UPI0026476DC7|nr:hypothetical protein [Yaniella sp.]MDN5732306.1 hypothetical protein [Yaniella sp.]MDN5818180.1 hypothetical protein [Yaniella sp.]MDN6456933.1 hypothetical protein [Yaniella sp.]MDN6488824.1 hypothetical protein [Yaniella sp.]MDN6499002.1 hypothetical protein [Yaniella sp.]
MKHPKRLIVLSIPVPAVFVVFVSAIFLVFRQVVSPEWAIHVDGHGNVTYGSWWALFLGSMAIALVALFLGQHLARDFSGLGHWYPQQKGIVVMCFAVGYGVLGFLISNMLSALGAAETQDVEILMGYGLLGFVLTAILVGIVYTVLLPKAKKITRVTHR